MVMHRTEAVAVLVVGAAAALLLIGCRAGEAPAADAGPATKALAAAMPRFAPPVATIDAAVSRPPPPVAPAVRLPPALPPEKPATPAPRPRARERAATLPTASFQARQVWRGEYVCAQGPTALSLTITDVSDRQVSAVFAFRHAPTGAAGTFRMRGTYDPSQRRIVFQPGAWIHPHPSYAPVGMDGRLNPEGDAFAGRIADPRCGAFYLRLN